MIWIAITRHGKQKTDIDMKWLVRQCDRLAIAIGLKLSGSTTFEQINLPRWRELEPAE